MSLPKRSDFVYTRTMSDRSLNAAQRDVQRLLLWLVWWYTDGLFAVLRWMRQELVLSWRALGIRLWIASFFRPMYGVNDWFGRTISIVMRAVILFFRGLWWVGELCAYVLLVVAWCVWIPFAFALLFV